MCGIVGIYNFDSQKPVEEGILLAMTHKLQHRGPDDASLHVEQNVGVGFRRLSIIDLANGQQPFFNEDRSVVMICNGEIFNYRELRQDLLAKGYRFTSECDVEVILHLYAEYGTQLVSKLNGQFAFAIYDKNIQELFLARDHFGICPLFYYMDDEMFLFASEIKALLPHPDVQRAVNFAGLDQIFSFPAIIAPTTLFKGVSSMPPGHFAVLRSRQFKLQEYWDLDYPLKNYTYEQRSEASYAEQLEELLLKSVHYRLNSDVPVGFYLSGGLDSSLIGALMKHTRKDVAFDSFSISFASREDKTINEQKYQQLMSRHLGVKHNDIEFDWSDMDKKLREVVYHSEAPLKETYNVCSLALSKKARQEKVKVVLSGEGADELFGGYAGYKFDMQRGHQYIEKDLEYLMEDQVRSVLWGDADFIYERNEYEFRDTKKAIYSARINEVYDEFDCVSRPIVNHRRIKERNVFNQRSYVDFKLRLAGHLIADHGDRMTFANSVEGRYPFLDINLVEFMRFMPPSIKLKGMLEKYILKQVANKYLPNEIIKREKFGFVAPGSPQLLKNNIEWVNDMLSYETIKKQGYFNPDTVERLKKLYRREDFTLTPPYDNDFLIIILTFNIFLEVFDMPTL